MILGTSLRGVSVRSVTNTSRDASRPSFGSRLRWWRAHRGLSQLELAHTAGTSQRHLSFLESGRTQPSREMVVQLATALDVPLRQQNVLLVAAGFAPVWRESDLAAPALAQVNAALDYILTQQEPYPAVVVDRRWNLLRANAGAGRLTQFLTGPAADPSPGVLNLAEWLLSPTGLRPFLVNWREVALHLIRGIEADALADGTVESAALLRRLLALPDLPKPGTVIALDPPSSPVLAMHFRKHEISLRLFTTIATLGTPQDVTLEELRIESLFPADAETASLLRSWAAG